MKRWILLLAAICLLCSGCTKSNIVPDGGQNNGEGDVPPSADGIVWEQLWEDFDEIYADTDAYPFIETVIAGVYDEDNFIRFYLLLNTTISGEEAAEYATEVIKGFNDLIWEQNHDYARSTEDSYGGYVSRYNIYVMVGPDDVKDNRETWILEDTIPAGEYRPVSPGGEEETSAES